MADADAAPVGGNGGRGDVGGSGGAGAAVAPDAAIPGEDARLSEDAPPVASDLGATLDVIAPDAPPVPAGAMSIFDGISLKGWDGSPSNWSVMDGAITGASNTTAKFPGTFIASQGDYGDFRLRLTERLAQSNNHLGICVWGSRLSAGNFGAGKCLVVIAPDGSMWDYGKGAIHGAKVGSAGVDQHTWHQVELVTHMATGEIIAAVNGVQITRYKDPDPSRFKPGPIRLQLHAWTGAQEVQYKDLVVESNITDYRLLTLK